MIPFEITKYDIFTYFLGIFSDSFILVLAFVFVICCIVGSLVYLLYLKKDDQYASSLLNVLNGDLMILLSLQSLLEFTELFFKKVLEEDTCVLVVAKKISNFTSTEMCFLLTIATLLNHFRF